MASLCCVVKLCAARTSPTFSRAASRGVQAWPSPCRRGASRICAAANTGKGPFQGTFGAWNIEPEDELEVWSYRGAISVVAASFCAGTLGALGPTDAAWAAALRDGGTALAVAGGGGMALATALIHIYVAPLKKALQVLLAVGAAGAAYLAVTHPEVPLPVYVAAHPSAVWLVGPAFAALTGITFKEGLCYGKLESAALAVLIPVWLLGHLSGLVPEAGERGLAAAIALLLAVFGSRKWTQAVKDDIGDKSVFQFYALPEEEQQRVIQTMRQQGTPFGREEADE